MHFYDSARSCLVGIVVAGAVLLASRPSRASQEFPAAIQSAAGMPCTPSCVVCHGEDPGTATSFSHRNLGKTLFNYTVNGTPSIVPPHGTAQLTTNYNAYKTTPEGAAVDALLKQGLDPETKADLCANGPTYGCGAHVAPKVPRGDLSALAWIAGAMVVGAVARRQRVRRG